jgi:hypothetical protein
MRGRARKTLPDGPAGLGRAAAALLALGLGLAGPARGGEPSLLPILEDGKWGFVDRKGEVVVSPRFDRAEPFSEGLAPVRLGERLGYADATGALVLTPAFDPGGVLHRPFVNGLAAVRVEGRFGYMDRDGKLAIAARFASAEDFSEGFALVCAEGVGCGYVDRAGRGVIGPGFMGGAPVKGGVACATLLMAMSRVRVALVKTDGSRLPGEYDGCGSLSDGLVAVRTEGRWGYLDAAGRGVIPPRFEWAGDFVDGLAPAKDDGGLCGYVDRRGEFAIPPRFRSCAAFSGGLARVDLARADGDREHWAFVDRTGRVVIDGWGIRPPFDSASDFREGAAAVGVGGEPFLAGTGPLLGYVDSAGRWIWPPTR